MAVDITSLVISVKSDGITDASVSLDKLTTSSEKAEKASISLKNSSKDTSDVQSKSAAILDNLIEKMQKQVDLLGANTSQTNAYNAAKKGASDLEQAMAGMLGAEVDAYKALGSAQAEAIKANKTLDTSYKALGAAADQYYASQTKLQDASNDAAWASYKVAEANKVIAAQAELIRMSKELAAQEARLSSDQGKAIVEDKARSYKILGDAQREAINMNNALDKSNKDLEITSQRAFNAIGPTRQTLDQATISGEKWVENLRQQTATLGMTAVQLKAYNIAQLEAQAATRGMTTQAAPMIQALKDTAVHAGSAHSGVAGITREFIVLAHEMSQGQFSRFGGSLMVMAEKFDVSAWAIRGFAAASAATGLGLVAMLGTITLAISAVVALGIAVMTFIHSARDLRSFNNELILTGGYAGTTGDALYDMATKIGMATGNLGEARKAAIELTASGRFTAEQIGKITQAAIELEHYAGVSVESTIKVFEKLAKEPLGNTERSFHSVSKAAMELDQKMHFLEPTVLAQILALENLGKSAEASKLAIDSMHDVLDSRIEQTKKNMTLFGSLVHDIVKGITTSWNSLFTKDSSAEALRSMKEQLTRNNTQDPNFEKTKTGKIFLAQLEAATAKANTDAASATKQAEEQELNRASNIALVHRNSVIEKMKGENTLQIELRQHRIEDDLLQKKGMGATKEAYEAMDAYLVKKYSERVAKPKSIGLTGMNDQIASLSGPSEAERRQFDNQIVLIERQKKYEMISAQEAADKKTEILDKQFVAFTASYESQIGIASSFYSKDVNLMNSAHTTKTKLIAKLQELQDTNAKRVAENAMALEYATHAGERATQKAFDSTSVTLDKEIGRLRDKNAAYAALPQSIKEAGLTEKQMQNYITDATIERLEAEKKQEGMTVFGIMLRDREISQLKEKRNLQITSEANDKTNLFVQGTGARLKEQAAMAVAEWNAAGKAIENDLTSTFGNVGKSIGDMFKSLTDGMAAREAGQERFNKVVEQQKGNPDDGAKGLAISQAQAKLNIDNSNASLKSYADLSGAAKSFFKEGSTGYKLLGATEKAFRLAELAGQAEKLYLAITTTAVKVAGNVDVGASGVASDAVQLPGATALAGVRAVGAVANQGNGDPYTAFGRIAAMIALMASIGLAVGGGGGASVDVAKGRQAVAGTGSVFGDSTAKSESIAKSIEIIEKDSGLGLVHSQLMVNSLKNIEASMVGLSNLVLRGNINNSSVVNTNGGAQNLFNSILGNNSIGEKLSGGLVGKLIGGIFGGATTALDNGLQVGKTTLGSANSNGVQANAYTDTKTSGGWFSSDSYNTSTKAVDSQVTSQIAMIVTSLGKGITQAANTLGMGGTTFTEHLNSFVVDIGKISLKGLTGDQIQKQFSAVFSKLGDDMAAFGVEGLAQFQNVGEGYLETLSRVANGFTQTTDVLSAMGQSFKTVGIYAVTLSENLILAAGGLDKLTTGTKFVVDNFFTEAQQVAPIAASVKTAMAALGESGVTTSEQFSALVLAQDLTTSAGQTMYSALLNIAPAFKTAADYAVALAEGTVTLTKVQQKSLDLVKTTRTALEDSYKAESSTLTDTITRVKAFTVSLKTFQDGLLLGAASPLTAAQKYAEARKQYDATLLLAQNGDATAQGKFTSVATALLDASKVINASGNGYTLDFAAVMAQTASLADVATTQVSTAQATLDALTKSVEGLITINASVLSVTQAIANLQSAIIGARAKGVSDVALGVVNPIVEQPAIVPATPAASSNPLMINFKGLGTLDMTPLVNEIKSLREEVKNLRADADSQTRALIQGNYDANSSAAEVVVDGVGESISKSDRSTTSISLN